MFSHIFVGTNDLDKARSFYDALFAAMGAGPALVDADKGRLIYRHNGSLFFVTRPINGEPATVSNGGTIGFTMASADMADAWHQAGVAHGGATCEDPPGVRSLPSGQLYLAYLRDPDGNKLCALYSMPN